MGLPSPCCADARDELSKTSYHLSGRRYDPKTDVEWLRAGPEGINHTRFRACDKLIQLMRG